MPGSRPSSSIRDWTGAVYAFAMVAPGGRPSGLGDELGTGERLGETVDRRADRLGRGVGELGQVDLANRRVVGRLWRRDGGDRRLVVVVSATADDELDLDGSPDD